MLVKNSNIFDKEALFQHKIAITARTGRKILNAFSEEE